MKQQCSGYGPPQPWVPDSSLEKVEREGVLEKNVRVLEEPFAKGMLQADVVIGSKGRWGWGRGWGQC